MDLPRRNRRRTWRRCGLALACLIGAWLLVSLAAVWLLTHRRCEPYPEPPPEIAWGRLQPLTLFTADGQRLGAWAIDGQPDRAVVIALHGNGGSRRTCLDLAELLAADGHPLLLPTLRGHGDSTGTQLDFGRAEREDLTAAVDWARQRHPGRPIVVWGRSLGAATGLFAAETLDQQVSGYVLECPYRDLRSAVRHRTRLRLPWGVEYAAYTGLVLTAPLVLADPDGIAPVEAAARVPRGLPVLILAGGLDRRATPDDAAAIRDQLDAAELVVFPDADHLELQATDPDRYRRLARSFLARVSESWKE